MSSRTGRRFLIGTGARAAGGLVAASMLAACGQGGLGKAGNTAHPTTGSGVVEITFAPWGQWVQAGAHWMNFLKPGMQYFEQHNRGIRVKVVAPGGGGGFATSILAGTAPDVFEDWVLPPYLAQNLVVNLDPYLRRDNLATSLWSPGQMHSLQTQHGTWFLPCYVHVDVMAINLTDLDTLGVSYPDPNWTSAEAAALYRKATWDKNGTHHFGVALDDMGGGMLGTATSDTRAYAMHIYGGSVMDASRTVCTLDDPRVVKAVTWFDQLYWDKVAGGNNIATNCTFAEFGSNNIPYAFTNYRNKFKWTFFPIPRYPAGRVCFEATDYHAISATSKHIPEAWALLRFLAAEPYWSRYCMKYLLRTPSLVSLWHEYVSVVESVAPQAKSVGLKWFIPAAQKWGIAGRTFKYQHPQAMTIINNALASALSRKQGVDLAMRSAAQQVNALQRSAAAQAHHVKGAHPASGTSSTAVSGTSSSKASGTTAAKSAVAKGAKAAG